jgi:anthranilate/para-aminobenzoate synthase component II
LGGRIVRAPSPVHGQASAIEHSGAGLFSGVPSPLKVGRYHSLVVERTTLPDDLRISAWTGDGIVMGLAHVRWPVYGVQFHPESILTQCGYDLLANFLDLAGLQVSAELQALANAELRQPAVVESPLPSRPITF